jgi:hypothetical protein
VRTACDMRPVASYNALADCIFIVVPAFRFTIEVTKRG